MITWFYSLSATLLVVSAVVHASTFFGCDPMTAVPGVWLLHLLIFAAFVPAIHYANKFGGKRQESQERIRKLAPAWMRILTGTCGAYALVNFVLMLVLLQGGSPYQRPDGSYVLQSGGRVIRELTREEFRRHRSYAIRLFSGHWMLFYSASMTLLAGAEVARRRKHLGSLVEEATEAEPREPTRPASPRKPRSSDNEWPSAAAGFLSLGAALGVVLVVIWGQPLLNVLAAVVTVVLGVRYFRGWRRKGWEKEIPLPGGCLVVVPSFFAAFAMSVVVCRFLYVAFYCGVVDAATGAVTFVHVAHGPPMLSNGQAVDGRVTTAMSLLIGFPLGVLGMFGLGSLIATCGSSLMRLRKSRREGEA